MDKGIKDCLLFYGFKDRDTPDVNGWRNPMVRNNSAVGINEPDEYFWTIESPITGQNYFMSPLILYREEVISYLLRKN